jgi:hypothetical protein
LTKLRLNRPDDFSKKPLANEDTVLVLAVLSMESTLVALSMDRLLFFLRSALRWTFRSSFTDLNPLME